MTASLEAEPLKVPGAWLLTPRRHADDRGMFCEWFRADTLAGATGRNLDLAQANCSVSARGVLRGIHYADVPPGQAKYVTCAAGSVLDVVVDIRLDSPTFGRWDAVTLAAGECRSVFLSEGLGHAFFALTEDATVLYLCSTPYAPEREHTIDPLDPEIGIAWPAGVPRILSERDAAAPTLRAAAEKGLLPTLEACRAWDEGIRS